MQIALEDKKSISKKNIFLFWVISLTIILVGTIVVAIAIGSTYIEPGEVYKVLLSKLTNREVYSDVGSVMTQNIIWEIRLPRVLLGAICGAGLAICGVLMQCVTKNPIAEPYILGISSGASCGAVFVIVLGGMSSIGINSVGAGAFVGSLISGILVFAIGTQMGKTTSTTRLVLSGMAISTIFSALTNLLIYSAENSNQAKSALFWTVGSLGGAKWEVLLFPFIILVVVMIGASDIIARGLFPPIEIPIGIITSLVGGPFFLYLISKKNYSFGGKE
ncbi:iron ABC transporter permease [Clostridium sp. ZBS13]|uniref:FecCD family ABC transporter permease n=1 Tax=Clostridium sp. ZBS13 TaxID=2949971 RepID=UPI00207A6D1F|nr:iron ABC transporter permease [Clostridium sp. ZBS13]